MKRIFNTVGNIIGVLIIIGAGIVLVLTLKGASPSDEQPTTFQSPIEKVVPMPTATSAPVQFSSPIKPTEPYVPPLCTFDTKDAIEKPISESLLDSYVFSEPRPVLDYEVSLDILGWLPGDQRLLVARSSSDSHTIDTINIQSLQIKTYAQGLLRGAEDAIWLEQGQEIAFPDYDNDGQYILQIARGNGNIRQGTTDLASFHLAKGPNGQRITFISKSDKAKPKFLNSATGKAEGIPFKEFKLPETKDPTHPFKTYKMTWHPDKKQLAYYSDQAFYIADTQTGNICELELGNYSGFKQWALSAHWSPDGQYLAIFNTAGELPVSFIDLNVIDMATGEQKILEIEGSGNKYAMAWAPNSRDMLVMTQNPVNDYGHNVYLVDVTTNNVRQILQDSPFLFSGNSDVAWSSNGKMIAISCFGPDLSDPRYLCLIDVKAE